MQIGGSMEEKGNSNRDKLFRVLFETSNVGILLSSLDGRIIEANSEFRNMVVYNECSFTNYNFEDLNYEKSYREKLINIFLEKRSNHCTVGDGKEQLLWEAMERVGE